MNERGGVGAAPLVEARGLTKHFALRRGLFLRQVGAVRAVDDLDLRIAAGETLGLVGESGSGKSTVGRLLLRLSAPTHGSVRVLGSDLAELSKEQLRRRRRDMQMVFQDPVASLDPRLPVGASIREPLDVHRIGTDHERRQRVAELLERVGLDPRVARRFPHEFSGGQRQRIGIARALATEPRFIVADEPISALDVSIQAQIVNLLADLKRELGLTYLFIAHDLAMVRHLSDRVAVLYLGHLMEIGPSAKVFRSARHPYTQALLSAVPVADPQARSGGSNLEGEIPDPSRPPTGCRFHPRCPMATEICRSERPPLREALAHGSDGPDHAVHRVACHHA